MWYVSHSSKRTISFSSLDILRHFFCVMLLVVSNLDLDKETIFGDKQLLSETYPCAEIYECSKCKLTFAIKHSLKSSSNDIQLIHLSAVCILLFSYELHRQLRLLEGSTQVSVMYVSTFHY